MNRREFNVYKFSGKALPLFRFVNLIADIFINMYEKNCMADETVSPYRRIFYEAVRLIDGDRTYPTGPNCKLFNAEGGQRRRRRRNVGELLTVKKLRKNEIDSNRFASKYLSRHYGDINQSL